MSGYDPAGTPGVPGEDGAPGAVQTVAGQAPDGAGDVALTVADIVGAAAAVDVAASFAAEVERVSDVYGIALPAPTGVAATDAAAVQAAHDALPATGGKIVGQRGHYELGDIGVVFTKPVWLTGQGRANITNYIAAATLFTFTDPAGTAITAGAGFRSEGFLLRYTGADVPTAGAGIDATGDIVQIDSDTAGFWINEKVDGALALIGGHNYGPVKYGLDLGNDLAPDSGDHNLTGWLTAADHDSDAAVHYRSGGGLKCLGMKINTAGGGKFLHGLDMELEHDTSDLLIDPACSIENTRSHAVNLRQAGATAAQFQNIGIYGQIAPYTAGAAAVNIAPANGVRLFVNIDIDIVALGQDDCPAVILDNVDGARVRGAFVRWTEPVQVSASCINLDLPDSDDYRWIPAQQLAVGDNFGGAITCAPEARTDAIKLSAAGFTSLLATLFPLLSWNAYTVAVYWTNAGAGEGDVVLRFDWQHWTDGDTLDAAGTAQPAVTSAAPLLDHVTHTDLATLAASRSKFLSLRIIRTGDDAADTLPNDIAVLGVLLRKVN